MERPEQKHTSKFNTDFCLLMTNHVLLKQVEKGSNFVSSPLSFHAMLSLITVGSTGRTLEQLLFFLGLKSVDELNSLSSQILAIALPADEGKNLEGGPVLSFVNGAWIDHSRSLKPSFERIVKGVYKGEAKQIDFVYKAAQVIDEVNSWAENATKGLIKELLPPGSLDSETALVFANALYFKGAWDRKFDASKTTDKNFHLLNGQVVQVPFMTTKTRQRHLYRSFDGYKVLKIPYQNGQDTRQFSMYFLLPDEKDGLPSLIQNFNSKPGLLNQQFELWEEELPDFWIPRFKFSFEFEASKTMIDLGLELPFTNVGEFTEMIDCSISDKLCVSRIFHKSYIEVNEEGTEAAASTALVMRWCCATYPTPSFVADHPFMFMIREETTGIVFFTGAVLNPLLNS